MVMLHKGCCCDWRVSLRRLACHPVQMEEDFIKVNPDWVRELEIMVTTKVKAEIQALSSFGFQYLTQVYLPLKLQEGDWI
jgi:DNA topoisomerase VI subunit A